MTSNKGPETTRSGIMLQLGWLQLAIRSLIGDSSGFGDDASLHLPLVMPKFMCLIM